MIKRYSSKEFEKIFSDENRFNNYLLIEEAVVEAYFKLGLVPEEDYLNIVKKAHIDLVKIEESWRASPNTTLSPLQDRFHHNSVKRRNGSIIL